MRKSKGFLNLLSFFTPFIFLIVPFFWFRRDSMIHGVDITFPLRLSAYLRKGVGAWDYTINAGRFSIFTIANYPEEIILRLLSLTGLPVNQLEIIFLFLIFSLILFSAYFFFRRLEKKDNVFPILATSFYIFNFFSLTRWESVDRAVLYLLAGVPLVLVSLLNLTVKESFLNYLFFGLSSIVFNLTIINFPSYLMGVVIVFLFALFFLLPGVVRSTGLILRLIIVFFLFNISWMPALVTFVFNLGGPGSAIEVVGTAEWLEPISRNTSFLNVIRLMGTWYWFEGWEGKPYAPYAQDYFRQLLLILLTYLMPLLVFWGFSKTKDKKKKIYFGLLGVIGLIFSMGVHWPFGTVFRFLYRHLFFFRLYRSPWFKFSLLTVFSYAYFYGVAGSYLLRKFNYKIYKYKIRSFFVAGLLFAFPVILNYPMVTGALFDSYRVKFPEAIFNYASWLEKNVVDGQRVVLLPFLDNESYPWGYRSGTPVHYYLTDVGLMGPWINRAFQEPTTPLLKAVKEGLYRGGTSKINNLLELLGVKYLVHLKDILPSEGDTVEFIQEKIAGQKSLHLVNSFGAWDVYQTPSTKPLFYITSDLLGTVDFESFLGSLLLQDRSCDYVYLDDLKKIDSKEFPADLPVAYRLTAKDFFPATNGGSYKFQTKKEGNHSIFLNANLYPSTINQVRLNGKLLNFSKIANDLFKSQVFLSKGDSEIWLSQSFLTLKNYFPQGDFEQGIGGWEKTNSGIAFGKEGGLIRSFDGKMLLIAKNQTLVARYRLTNLPKNQSFRLSFDFKNLGPRPLQVGIWQESPKGAFLLNPEEKNYYSSESKRQQIVFSSQDADSLYIYFYALVDTFKRDNEVLIDNLRIEEDRGLRSLVVLPEVAVEKSIDFLKITNGHYRINLTTEEPGWLVYNGAFNKWWRAEENSQSFPHVMVNSFANGFFISEPGPHQIEIYYYPQKLFIYSRRIFSFIFLTFMVGVCYQGIKRILASR